MKNLLLILLLLPSFAFAAGISLFNINDGAHSRAWDQTLFLAKESFQLTSNDSPIMPSVSCKAFDNYGAPIKLHWEIYRNLDAQPFDIPSSSSVDSSTYIPVSSAIFMVRIYVVNLYNPKKTHLYNGRYIKCTTDNN